MTTPYRLSVVQATAWRIVCELFRRHAASVDLQLLETHSSISICGQLNLLIDPSARDAARRSSITFNFGGPSGTCDLRVGGSIVAAEMDFVSPMLREDPIVVIAQLERLLGLQPVAQLPPSSPAVLAVRTIAGVLERDWLSRTDLRATLGWVDASAGCSVPQWTRVFGADLTRLADEVNHGKAPWQVTHAQLRRYVALHASEDGGPMIDFDRQVAALDLVDGLRILAGPDGTTKHIQLAKAYRDARRRMGAIVDGVLAHLGRSSVTFWVAKAR